MLPLVSCVEDSVSAQNTDKTSQSVDTEKGTEALTDETKESEKATEGVSNGELNNGNSGNENGGNENSGNENGGNDNSGNDDNTDNSGNSGGGLGEFVPEVVYHTVSYVTDGNGYIDGEASQKIEEGGASYPVKAVPNDGYVFAGWSDGNNSDVRSEKNVRKDISVSPIFISADYRYTVYYETRMGGKLIKQEILQARADEVITYKAPNAPLAYVHGEWSDGKEGQTRVDNIFSDNNRYVLEIEPLSLSKVPTIEIITENGVGIAADKSFNPCVVTLSNTDESGCFEELPAQIRGRGKSSWNAHEKKGFKLKFDEQLKMLGSSYKSKNWNFISNHADKSFIRNMIAYDMSAAFDGIGYTTTHKYIDVYLDNEYYGFFMLCDDIDVGKGRINYDKTIYDDPEKMTYLLEVGGNHSHAIGTACFKIERDRNYSCCVKYPDADDPGYDPNVHLAYISDYVDQCLLALSNQDWELIRELIDIDSFIDHYIIQEIFANKDAFWCSVYFYKVPNGKLYAGPVWDFDQGAGCVPDYFGAGHDDVRPDADINYANSSVKKNAGVPWVSSVNTWYRRLFRNEEFVELVRARLKETGPIIMKVLEKADPENPDGYYA
ncbi:MAG: CotH kinase family protein, partial [Clostridia bacterium]|nr:CotH kinase family protein [Clostridia bacterium]